MKRWKAIAGFCITLAAIAFVCIGHTTPRNLKAKAQELENYCRKHGYNTEVGILVDYGRHSGKVRFFVYDFRKKKVLLRSIAAQGWGKKGGFSNEKGSHCSSLGHYKIGRKRGMYSSKRRETYELDGLDASNSNARSRAILLHQVYLPPFTLYPLPIINGLRIGGKRILPAFSDGCITLPCSKFDSASEILGKRTKPVIMWVYN